MSGNRFGKFPGFTLENIIGLTEKHFFIYTYQFVIILIIVLWDYFMVVKLIYCSLIFIILTFTIGHKLNNCVSQPSLVVNSTNNRNKISYVSRFIFLCDFGLNVLKGLTVLQSIEMKMKNARYPYDCYDKRTIFISFRMSFIIIDIDNFLFYTRNFVITVT